MTTRMTHPKHGVTHAYGAEIAWNIANGWKVEPKNKPADVPHETYETGLSDDIRTLYIAKFGKPPHHRMKDETIADALKD